jgi:ABC-type uncharacterized transport system ATPase subunit
LDDGPRKKFRHSSSRSSESQSRVCAAPGDRHKRGAVPAHTLAEDLVTAQTPTIAETFKQKSNLCNECRMSKIPYNQTKIDSRIEIHVETFAIKDEELKPFSQQLSETLELMR